MSLRNPGCPFCGMPPLDGEPCCTREFQRETMRKADRELADLRAYRDRTEAALSELTKRIHDYENDGPAIDAYDLQTLKLIREYKENP